MTERGTRGGMEITSTGLLACPLCGGRDLRVESYGIECRYCGLWLGDGTKVRDKFGTVQKAWNTRHANAPHQARRDSGVALNAVVGQSGGTE